jgi:type II secretory pathway component PulJ
VPSPWISYVLLSLVFSAMLVLLTVRMLRPAADAPSSSAPRLPKEQREPA